MPLVVMYHLRLDGRWKKDHVYNSDGHIRYRSDHAIPEDHFVKVEEVPISYLHSNYEIWFVKDKDELYETEVSLKK